MSNPQEIKNYLIRKNEDEFEGYLVDSSNNSKVIMLSGKWGCGKTHFWQDELEEDLKESQSKKQKAYTYVSLYGKTTLDEIKENLFAQAYFCSIGGQNTIVSSYDKLKNFGKRFGSFCSLVDISKVVEGVEEYQKENVKWSALSALEHGGLICFDDFERKSKDIDLNDLFGFITHLAIDLKCKVVIILNDDVFEGEEKDIFTNVKEKSVSKFLNYNPSIRYLFKQIFFQKEENTESKKVYKYSKLRKYRSTLLKTIEETGELNARIYMQVLDNLLEWIDNKQDDSIETIRCLILVNINFILYHIVFDFWDYKLEHKDKWVIPSNFLEFKNFSSLLLNLININFYKNDSPYRSGLIDLYKSMLESEYATSTATVNSNSSEKAKPSKKYEDDLECIDIYSEELFSFDKMERVYKFREYIEDDLLKKINRFISTGILIDKEE